MSDAPQGPGWWQASDGRWYPPEGELRDVLPASAYPPAPTGTAGKATAALVLSILSFVLCPIIPAIAALIVAAKAKKEIDASYGRLGGEGQVKAARILSVVHLVLSVLMIPVLLAIAVPTFLGARDRAWDRAAQSTLRNALTAELTWYTDQSAWTDDPAQLTALEPSIVYEPGAVPVTEDVVYVVVEDQLLGLSARSESGTCYYVMGDAAAPGEQQYAEDEDCGPVQDQSFGAAWD
jgi:type IV pilus assembly protein PilA